MKALYFRRVYLIFLLLILFFLSSCKAKPVHLEVRKEVIKEIRNTKRTDARHQSPVI
jgi:lipoprotein